MKTLVTSDLHGNLDKLDLTGIDLVLLAGDIAPLNDISSPGVRKQLKWFNTTFKDWCMSMPTMQFVFIPGNHDMVFDSCKAYSGVSLDKLDFASNAHLLIDSEITINGVRIYGTPWVPIINHFWAFEADLIKQRNMFSKIPEGIDILLTHTPPKYPACYLDVSLYYGRESDKFGSAALTDMLIEKSPKWNFSGHIHTGHHKYDEPYVIGNTKCVNVSRLNENYSIEFEPFVFDIN